MLFCYNLLKSLLKIHAVYNLKAFWFSHFALCDVIKETIQYLFFFPAGIPLCGLQCTETQSVRNTRMIHRQI